MTEIRRRWEIFALDEDGCPFIFEVESLNPMDRGSAMFEAGELVPPGSRIEAAIPIGDEQPEPVIPVTAADFAW